MTLNLLFVSINIQRKRQSREDLLHEEQILKMYEEQKIKHYSHFHLS
ncbi:YrzI family small protein [Bacillus sp. 2205SS5-2]